MRHDHHSQHSRTAGHRVASALATAALAAGVLGAGFALATPSLATSRTGSPTSTSPTAHDPIGRSPKIIAAPNGLQANGWAADPDALQQNLTVYAVLDGRSTIAHTVTSLPNGGVQKAYGTGPTPGYSLSVPLPSGAHTVCFVARNVGPGTSTVLGCVATPLGTHLSAAQLATHSPSGAVTSSSATSSTLTVSGWASDPDYLNRKVLAVLYVDGSPVSTVLSGPFAAGASRPTGAGTNAAYSITTAVSTGTHIACVWIVNVGFGSNSFLGCTALDTRGPAGTGPVTTPALNQKVMAEALKHRGQAYVWGSTGPKTFDCSGLVLYSYGKQKMTLPRVSEAQALSARLIPASRAVPGDLVFYHDEEGDVYHVGLYAKPGVDFAAIDEQEGVNYQTIWDPSSVTYGSFTHT